MGVSLQVSGISKEASRQAIMNRAVITHPIMDETKSYFLKLGDPVPEDLIPQEIKDLHARASAALKANSFNEVEDNVIVDLQRYPAVGIHGKIPTDQKVAMQKLLRGCLDKNTQPDDFCYGFVDNPDGTSSVIYFPGM